MVIVLGRQATQAGGIGSLESIPGSLKSLKFRTPELEFLKRLWGLGTEEEQVIVVARKATQADGIGSLEQNQFLGPLKV